MLRFVIDNCFFCTPCLPKKNDTLNFQTKWGNDFNKITNYLEEKKLQYQLIPETQSIKITFNNSPENLLIQDLHSFIESISKNSSYYFEIESNNQSTLIITRKLQLKPKTSLPQSVLPTIKQ
jgi:hypothetical protein